MNCGIEFYTVKCITIFGVISLRTQKFWFTAKMRYFNKTLQTAFLRTAFEKILKDVEANVNQNRRKLMQDRRDLDKQAFQGFQFDTIDALVLIQKEHAPKICPGFNRKSQLLFIGCRHCVLKKKNWTCMSILMTSAKINLLFLCFLFQFAFVEIYIYIVFLELNLT